MYRPGAASEGLTHTHTHTRTRTHAHTHTRTHAHTHTHTHTARALPKKLRASRRLIVPHTSCIPAGASLSPSPASLSPIAVLLRGARVSGPCPGHSPMAHRTLPYNLTSHPCLTPLPHTLTSQPYLIPQANASLDLAVGICKRRNDAPKEAAGVGP